MLVLVVTRSDDNDAVALVQDELEKRGARVVRFDTDRFPTDMNLGLSTDVDHEDVVLEVDGQRLSFSEVDALWYRRLNPGARLPTSMAAQLRRASVEESHACIVGALSRYRGPIIDAYDAIRAAEIKPRQLARARALGMDVPRTLTTNDPEAVRAFAASCPGGLVAKMLSSFAISEGGAEQVVFTNRVTAEDLTQLDSLRLGPMTFQEHLQKAVELRVTVVGERIFSAAVDVSKSPRAAVDWRRDGARLVDTWTPHALPPSVEPKLLALVRSFGLTYSAADFVITPEGRCVFLESNPAGEWFWLQKFTGLPIGAALADALTAR